MEITTKNQIKQELLYTLEKGTAENAKFMTLVKKFLEDEGKQIIEGQIEKLNITINWSGDLEIQIKTLKEDKLKLLENNAIDVN